ncbi:MAG: DUF1134 domain-containing protein [Methylocystis sp.]|jgi:hypothetical protein|nr:DUF1134 domain-containing protein [Methylocystis sp.]MCA3582957.1 DUF1134 domain-containing protein [Methylocystis sp.]MCA3587280.1 DUF1134 domain-containing protein [Methylocystis sp.]MCA3590362.1 DUF1134 domain-containing protein [Methylocystis sp.]
MRKVLSLLGLVLGLVAFASIPANAQRQTAPAEDPNTFSGAEIVQNGHHFFGSLSRGLALTVEEANRRWGEPNGYILGQEGSGAYFAGLRFGEGVLYTRNAGEQKVYWQGPSVGLDWGGDGARTMILVYNLQNKNSIFQRFGGANGSAYLVAGFGMTALTSGDGVTLVPIRTGIGARLGVNLGYLKFTDQPTWNPF